MATSLRLGSRLIIKSTGSSDLAIGLTLRCIPRGDRHRLQADCGIAEHNVIACVLGSTVENSELDISFSGCGLKLFELLKIHQLRCHLGVSKIEELQSPTDGLANAF